LEWQGIVETPQVSFVLSRNLNILGLLSNARVQYHTIH